MPIYLNKKGTRKYITPKYQEWLFDFVKNGKAHEYNVVKTWDVVLLETKVFGQWAKYEITEKSIAQKLIDSNPLTYRIKSINVEKVLTRDFKTSAYCNRFRLVAWMFFTMRQVPIIKLNRQRTNNIIVVWLMLLTIIVMFYLAKQERII